jgi:hypothetical protein
VERVSHTVARPGGATASQPLPAAAAKTPPADEATAQEPFDATAESAADGLADEAAHRAEKLMLAQSLDDQVRQTRLDRVRAAFDADQAERAEYEREMNVLRDMALEQQKHDDEILKKWIALI